MKDVPREKGLKFPIVQQPPVALTSGSVMAINSRGTRYACQPLSVAPENRLIAPTGAKFDACGMRRSNPPITVKLNADDDLDGVFIATNPLSLYQMPPGSVPTKLPARPADGSPSGSRQRTRR